MSKPNLLAIWAKHERGEGATNEELGHLIERFESLQDRLEQAEENLAWALEANKRWAHRSSRKTSELRKAEQAVARVREVLEHHTFVADDKYGGLPASQYYGDSEVEAVAAKIIIRALDGDGRA